MLAICAVSVSSSVSENVKVNVGKKRNKMGRKEKLGVRKKGAKKRKGTKKHTGGYSLEWPVLYTDYTHTAAINTTDEWKIVTVHIRKKLLEGATMYGENCATLRRAEKFYAPPPMTEVRRAFDSWAPQSAMAVCSIQDRDKRRGAFETAYPWGGDPTDAHAQRMPPRSTARS